MAVEIYKVFAKHKSQNDPKQDAMATSLLYKFHEYVMNSCKVISSKCLNPKPRANQVAAVWLNNVRYNPKTNLCKIYGNKSHGNLIRIW